MLEIPEHYVHGENVRHDLPWLTPEAVIRLDAFLKPWMQVLEYGIGGSTVFFAQRCLSVVSFEHSEAWCRRVQARLDELHLTNVELCHFSTHSSAVKMLSELLDCYFDVVLNDGNSLELSRAEFAAATLRTTAWPCLIINDNYGDHHKSYCALYVGPEYRVECFDDPEWSGKGTQFVWRSR